MGIRAVVIHAASTVLLQGRHNAAQGDMAIPYLPFPPSREPRASLPPASSNHQSSHRRRRRRARHDTCQRRQGICCFSTGGSLICKHDVLTDAADEARTLLKRLSWGRVRCWLLTEAQTSAEALRREQQAKALDLPAGIVLLPALPTTVGLSLRCVPAA